MLFGNRDLFAHRKPLLHLGSRGRAWQVPHHPGKDHELEQLALCPGKGEHVQQEHHVWPSHNFKSRHVQKGWLGFQNGVNTPKSWEFNQNKLTEFLAACKVGVLLLVGAFCIFFSPSFWNPWHAIFRVQTELPVTSNHCGSFCWWRPHHWLW